MPTLVPPVQTLNGLPVVEMNVSFPRIGAWVGDFVVQNPVNPLQLVPTGVPPTVGQPCAIVVNEFAFLGSCVSSQQQELGLVRVRVVGGLTGGYARPVVPVNLGTGPTAQVAASAMLGASGEALNPALSNPVCLNALFKGWQAFAPLTLSQAMTQLAVSVGCAWRIDYVSGLAYLFIDPFLVPATLPSEAAVTEALEGVGLDFDCPYLDALPMPGQVSPDGTPVNEVILLTTPTSVRVQLRTQQMNSFLPVAGDAAAVRFYPCTVLDVNPGDGTASCIPDDVTVLGPAFARCRVRSCSPSVTLSVLPGTRCLVGFDAGDPSSLPAIVAFDAAVDTLLTMTWGEVPLAQPLARAVDLITALTTYSTAGSTLAAALAAYAVAIKAIADPSNTATPVLTAAVTAFEAASAAFVAALATVPSRRLLSD